ncbi:MAG: phage tail terminator-like protein [Pseudomonadota bacterium]
MSIVAIRAALETQLAAINPSIATAWENDEFTPPALSVPYQAVNLLPAQPGNDESGQAYTQQGILLVSLRYPVKAGSADAAARAELIQTAFARGTSFVTGNINIIIDRTPEIAPGRVDEDRFVLPVRIRFFAQVGA